MSPVPSKAAQEFLAEHGYSNTTLAPIAGDASPRRYFRLQGQKKLLMEDPDDPKGFAAFARVSAHLNALGLSAPKVLNTRPEGCLALIEDFGDATYNNLLSGGADEEELYALAIDAILHLHNAPDSAEIAQPDFNLDYVLNELTLFADWYAPAICPNLNRSRFRDRFLNLWGQYLAPIAGKIETLILRDFHVDNLMILPDRTGVRKCGLLDFQDAVRGPCEYDIVSLLQDARRDLGDGLEEKMLARYLAKTHTGRSAEQTRHRYAVLGAQRHMRIAGVFVRLCQRDGKPRYLTFLPRVLRQIETALKNAGLTELEALLDQELSGWRTGENVLTQLS